MEKDLWFRAKRYGWGWTPSTWQGWLVTVVYLIIVLVPIVFFGKKVAENVISFQVCILLLTSLYILLCYKKGESPRWSWGKNNTDK